MHWQFEAHPGKIVHASISHSAKESLSLLLYCFPDLPSPPCKPTNTNRRIVLRDHKSSRHPELTRLGNARCGCEWHTFICGVDFGTRQCQRASNARDSTMTPSFDQSTPVNLAVRLPLAS
jgi:hypothetical protein